MIDVVDTATRSRMMSGIKGKNTRPELLIRSALHRRGFRFRLHDKKLPGRPDLVLPKYHAVIQIHGCFWHGHNCHLFRLPSTRTEFWREKIAGNVVRDKRSLALLREQGWRVLIIYECALKGKHRLTMEYLMERVARWILAGEQYLELQGTQ